MIDRNPQVRLSSGIVFNKIKDLYNKNKRQNSSIACAYNGLYSFKNFTTYLESQKGNISQQLIHLHIILQIYLYQIRKKCLKILEMF